MSETPREEGHTIEDRARYALEQAEMVLAGHPKAVVEPKAMKRALAVLAAVLAKKISDPTLLSKIEDMIGRLDNLIRQKRHATETSGLVTELHRRTLLFSGSVQTGDPAERLAELGVLQRDIQHAITHETDPEAQAELDEMKGGLDILGVLLEIRASRTSPNQNRREEIDRSDPNSAKGDSGLRMPGEGLILDVEFEVLDDALGEEPQPREVATKRATTKEPPPKKGGWLTKLFGRKNR